MIQLLPFDALPAQWRFGTGMEGSTLTPALSQAWEREKAERLEEVRVPASPFSCAAAEARVTRCNCREYAPAKLPQGSESGAQKGDKGAAWLLYLIVRKRVSACCLIYGSVGERSKPPDCKSGAVMATEVRILPGPPR